MNLCFTAEQYGNFTNDCCVINCEAPIKLFVIFDSRYESAAINYLHRPSDVLSLQKSDSAMLCPLKVSYNFALTQTGTGICQLCAISERDSGTDDRATLHTGLATCTPQEGCEGLK